MTTKSTHTPETAPVVLTQATESIERHIKALRRTTGKMFASTKDRSFTPEEKRVCLRLIHARDLLESMIIDRLG